MISDNTHRIQMPEGEVRELASPQGLLWERAVRELKSRLEQAYVTRNNGIKGLKAYGGSPVKHKAEKLWGRYVPCEYIESSDTQYIDTGIIPTVAKETDILLKISANTLGGQTEGFGSNSNLNVVSESVSSGYWRLNAIVTAIPRVIDEVVDIELKQTSSGRYYKIKTEEGYGSKVENSVSFWLGTLNGAAYKFKGKYYSVIIKENNTLVRDFIPVKDVVSNVYGLWDRVEGKFYGNAGTGAFTGGELIQPIAYAESDGTQYFDTNFRRTSGNAYKAEVNAEPTGAGSFFTLGADFMGYVIKKYSDGTVGMGVTSKLSDDNTRKIYTIELAADGINSVLTTPAGSTSNTRSNANYGYNVNIGRCYVDDYGKAKYYGVKLLENSNLVRDYLPVRVGTSVELLDLVSWTFATRVGTFTAGADIPYTQLCPDIIKVNTGDIRYGVGKNLFDIAHVVWGYNIGEDGIEASSQYNSHSDYIECKPNTTYTVSWISNYSGGTVTRYHEYNGDKTWLRQITTHGSSGKGEKSVTFTTGETARYICFTFRGRSTSDSQLSTDIQLEEGSTATPYEPYAKAIRTDGEHKVIVGGKNLFNNYEASIEAGKTYTISAILTNGTRKHIYTYDADGTQIRDLVSWASTAEGYKTATFTANAGEVKCICTTALDQISKLQIEEGNIATPYEPYIAPQIRDIPMLLSAESNLDIQSGVKTEAWGIKVLDGTENWGLATSNIIAYCPINNGLTGDPITFRIATPCSHFVGTDKLNANMPNYSIKLSVTSAELNISKVFIKTDGNVIDLTSFKAWLASEYAKGTPVIILYPLATPVTEQVTIAPVTSARRTTYIADSDSELGKTNLELDFLGK